MTNTPITSTSSSSGGGTIGNKKRKHNGDEPTIVTSNNKASKSSSAEETNMFWQWNIEDIDTWIRSIAALFPPQPVLPTAATSTTTTTETSEEHAKKEAEWKAQVDQAEQWTLNLVHALESATQPSSAAASSTDDHHSEEQQHQHDVYNIMDSSFSRGEDVVYIGGAVLSRLGEYIMIAMRRRQSSRCSKT